VEAALATGLVDQAAGADGTGCQLTMPKFEFRTQAGSPEALKTLGMRKAFGDADFSAMTKQEALSVSDVIHEAFIAVDEEGTEAAAATAVVMLSSAFSPEVQLTVDRPFLFALRDRDTGAVLFLGRVTDPTAA
jgi:serpin B